MTVNLCLNDKDFIMRLPRIALLALPLTLLAACGGGEFYAVELAYDPILAKDGTVVEPDWTVVNTYPVEED
ncbi:hypothetical protein SAMN05421853_102241 [Roseivivax halotolerans]|jgi:hypothetical protein|uniref:Uncharacterized protein n=2 Tax=Roseobacteraceae TaxID=2854170 RepID=A0A1I5WBR3_9RHOB|nr:hypothetical protein FIU91_14435 [Roseivivax sp. THAF30]SFQ17129.1 hypothetical protein SAMN05421853_102241 [Roseivivax halotolerans]